MNPALSFNKIEQQIKDAGDNKISSGNHKKCKYKVGGCKHAAPVLYLLLPMNVANLLF